MDQMKTWFVSNGIIDHFELFTEKGFDLINLVVDYVTEDRLCADFPEISRPGDRQVQDFASCRRWKEKATKKQQ